MKKHTIPGYSNYYIQDNRLYTQKGKEVTIQKRGDCKVKNDLGEWKGVALSKLLALSGDVLELPEDAKPLREFPEYYIDTKANVYSFSSKYPQGVILKPSIGSNGYLRVSIGKCNKDVHTLLADTFIYPGYVGAGLVCMHKDNNKLNLSLDNLRVGTYSENNKQAYDDGLNPGNGL